MKRSEMIEHLRSLIEDNHVIDEACLQFPNSMLGFRKGQLNEILSGLEELGMLPPENPNLSQEVIDNRLSGNYWEPEE